MGLRHDGAEGISVPDFSRSTEVSVVPNKIGLISAAGRPEFYNLLRSAHHS